MPQFSPDTRTRIIEGLKRTGASQPCPRCANINFTLLDGYFPVGLQGDLAAGLVIGGPTVPAVAVACDRCGFLAFHALGRLVPIEATGAQRA